MRHEMQLALFHNSALIRSADQNHIDIARKLRDKGIKQVSDANAAWLETLREAARTVCREKGRVTADDLRTWCDANRYWPTHPNAYGAILTKREFVPGEFIQSTQAQRRGGHVRVWRLKIA